MGARGLQHPAARVPPRGDSHRLTSCGSGVKSAVSQPGREWQDGVRCFRDCQGRQRTVTRWGSWPRSLNNSDRLVRPKTSRCSRLWRLPKSAPTTFARWKRAISTCFPLPSISVASCAATPHCSSWMCRRSWPRWKLS